MSEPLMPQQLAHIGQLVAAATPGPWYWNLNLKSRCLCLESSGVSMRETVMDFVRWGMQGAVPRFRRSIGKENRDLVILSPADEFAEEVEGRRHHASWFQTVAHPDAKLIAAAPVVVSQLLAEVHRLRAMLTQYEERYPDAPFDRDFERGWALGAFPTPDNGRKG